ncbi:ATPase [Thermoproteus uzoniensis 768-20]|uniref:ATPase n=1 Tax=Thermoproteus uzoniensis (strain 768-20) TaxID=999630 RepID=F2L6A6_THEU7|nr:ATP-binding protein [Thermoproteus uzoniensis]AEA12502.1 ATPase [Thermoproteus uzoniensis 768-20]
MVVPALFKLEPKESLEELYDFEEELRMLRLGYEKGRITAVLGLRRTGKSSLVRSFLNGLRVPHIYIDARRAALATGRATARGFAAELGRALTEFLRREASLRDKLIQALGSVRGISVSAHGLSVALSWSGGGADLASLLEAVDRVAEEAGERVAVAIDEVQELRGAGVGLAKLLAYIYDNLPNLVAIVTGSQIGLVYDILRLDDPESPLYGRAVVEIRTRRLGREQALDFLRRGFGEAGISPPEEELERAVDLLDGIIGWLTYYGWARTAGAGGLEEIADTAARQEAAELERFLLKSRAEERYRAILKAVALRPMRWSEIKMAVEAREGAEIDDKNFTALLHYLVKMGILEKAGDLYSIPDPIVRRAVERYLR